MAAASGAASPLLFGTGATSAQVAAKSLNPFLKGGASLPASLAQRELQDAQRSLVGRTVGDFIYDKVTPRIGSVVSGIREDSIRNLRANPGIIDDIAAKGELGYAEDAMASIKNPVMERSRDLGSKIDETLSAISDHTELVAADLGERASLAAAAGDEQAARAVAAEAADMRDRLMVDANKSASPFLKLLDDYKTTLGRNPTPENAESVQAIEETISRFFTEDHVDVKSAWRLRQKMSKLGQSWKTGNGTKNTMPAAASDVQKGLINAGRESADILLDEMDRVGSNFSEGTIKSSFGDYARLQKQRAYLDKYTKDPQKAFRNLSNLMNDSRAVEQQIVAQQMPAGVGDDMIRLARDLETYRDFKTGSLLPFSRGSTTSTSRTIPLALGGAGLGYWVGANSGLGQGGAGVGGFAGGALGSMLGGPAALRSLHGSRSGNVSRRKRSGRVWRSTRSGPFSLALDRA